MLLPIVSCHVVPAILKCSRLFFKGEVSRNKWSSDTPGSLLCSGTEHTFEKESIAIIVYVCME